MKQLVLVCISISIALLSCDRPECTNTNRIFSQYPPSSMEYKMELIARLRDIDPNELSYWLDEFVENSGKEYLQVYIQGKGICAKGLMKVETWTEEIEGIKKVKGISYEGAKLKGLSYSIEETGAGVELVYKGLDRIID